MIKELDNIGSVVLQVRVKCNWFAKEICHVGPLVVSVKFPYDQCGNKLALFVCWWLISELTINNNRNNKYLQDKIVGIRIYFDISTFKPEDVNIFFSYHIASYTLSFKVTLYEAVGETGPKLEKK